MVTVVSVSPSRGHGALCVARAQPRLPQCGAVQEGRAWTHMYFADSITLTRSRIDCLRLCLEMMVASIIPAARQCQAHTQPEWGGSSHGCAIQTAWWQRRHSIPARVK